MENVARAIRIAYGGGGIEEFAGHEGVSHQHDGERAHPLGDTPLWKVGFEDCVVLPNCYGGCGAAGGRQERGKRNDVKVHVWSAVRPGVTFATDSLSRPHSLMLEIESFLMSTIY
ncbi:hypothetical protein TNCT_151451 [Trichonephila clavata]|uniref:Uncharacterized protein n=1 Tax=Trichonephila clavata TaxID=2740835 RepID=A0A8X6I323_TRICU|nr:hypothetical protein TNCT_151451 [Trichonephila clavata]